MKKDFLIKQIASEFNVDEIKVSEYFDSIFETLAAAFIKNKNVNISEFGKFSVRKKRNGEGEQKKTVLFSPVRKFAEEINYNFGELKPVQIRLMDSAVPVESRCAEFEDETEEILLIDFEDNVFSSSQTEEVLIHEGSEPETPVLETEKKKTEILIPESEQPEMPTLKTEERKEEVLIHEVTAQEICPEKIPEEIKKEFETTPADEGKSDSINETKIKIFGILDSVEFPARIFDFKKPGKKDISSAAKTISRDTTVYIKEEKPGDIKPAVDKIEEEIEQLKAYITEEIQEDIKPSEEIISAGSIKKEDTPEVPKQNIFADEKSEEIIDGEQKDELPKSSLELEAELLQMLEERKKILEEISRLEKSDTDDVVDISGPKKTEEEEKPKLHDESTLDRPRQNVFADDEGKILEELLGLISGEAKTGLDGSAEPPAEQKSETTEKFTPEEKEEINLEEEEKKEPEPEEKPEVYTPEQGPEINPDKLFEDLFGKQAEEQNAPENEETKAPSFNAEMKIFDKLLDEPIIPAAEEKPEKDENGLTSFSELEEMFRNFKTETDEEKTVIENTEQEKTIEENPEIIQEKTEAIKTYDDITNLLGPNGEKKEEKKEILNEPSKKTITPGARMTIIMVTILIAIIVFVVLYQKFVNKPSGQNMQIPVPHPADSTLTKGSDSVIYADTNKTTELEEAEVVFEKDDKVIKETPKGFYIEFGEYENQFELAKEIKALKDKGITPGYEEIKSEGKTFYKMKLGPFNSLKEAKAILPKL